MARFLSLKIFNFCGRQMATTSNIPTPIEVAKQKVGEKNRIARMKSHSGRRLIQRWINTYAMILSSELEVVRKTN